MLIVDDHARFRAAARALLEADGFVVVGMAADGETAVAETVRLRPDIVLLDIQLPDQDGFAVAVQLASLERPPHVVLISTRQAADFGARLESASACGFITKRELGGAALAKLLP